MSHAGPWIRTKSTTRIVRTAPALSAPTRALERLLAPPAFSPSSTTAGAMSGAPGGGRCASIRRGQSGASASGDSTVWRDANLRLGLDPEQRALVAEDPAAAVGSPAAHLTRAGEGDPADVVAVSVGTALQHD